MSNVNKVLQRLHSVRGNYTSQLSQHKKNIEEYEKQRIEHALTLKKIHHLTVAKQGLHKVQDQVGVEVRELVTDILNKTLENLFPNETLTVSLVANDEKPTKTRTKKQATAVASAVYKRLDLEIAGADGEPMNVAIQVGSGLQDLISFLYRVSLISVGTGRNLLVSDELLHGLNVNRFKDIAEIVHLFADTEDFQFIFIEHGFDPALWGHDVSVLETERKNNTSYLNDVTEEVLNRNSIISELKSSIDDALSGNHAGFTEEYVSDSENVEETLVSVLDDSDNNQNLEVKPKSEPLTKGESLPTNLFV